MHAASVPRTLLIAAHPDDETIGAGIRISHTPGIQVVHLTDGSPVDLSDALAAGFSNQETYANARREEAARALAIAGVAKESLTNLCFTDQQLSFSLEDLTLQVLTLLERFRPDLVLTHPYEGGHPDHDAVAFACNVAKKLLEQKNAAWNFGLLEFTSYHADNGGIRPYAFLPSNNGGPCRYYLSPREQRQKINMLQAFTTQARTLAPFMNPEYELFRIAPQYDFRRPPHNGKLFYEYFDWGLDGTAWRELASQTLRRLL
ncbi:MAG TPA: PIG-L family deacetylase [Candidatus Sulfotelmatobacter sp.]|nr:PIG-L family deacetylase [Candidatus Sulfotelmatobacter sp.]